MYSKIINFYGSKSFQKTQLVLLILAGLYLIYVFIAQGSDKLTIYKVIYGAIVFTELCYLAFGRLQTTNSKTSALKLPLKVFVIIGGVVAFLAILAVISLGHGFSSNLR